MSLNFIELKEHIRLKKGILNISTIAVSGKEGDSFVIVSPTLLVSAYADNEEEAKKSFEENMLLFCEDLMAMTVEQRDTYIKSLGFEKVKYHNKNYSKAYIDENGVLKGMDLGKLSISTVETATAC